MPSLKSNLVSVTRIACLQAPRGHIADMSVSMSAMCPLDHMQLEDTTMRDTKRKYRRQSRNGATTATPPASRGGATWYCRLGSLTDVTCGIGEPPPVRAVSGTAGTDTTSPLWQPQPAKTTRRGWREERGLPQWLSHIVFIRDIQLPDERLHQHFWHD